MKICAVICELNPLHNGHKYIFDEARRISGCDYVLAVMGGNFCQRAEAAIVDEYVRTSAALKCGADIVVELPAVYASAAGDAFARGAVSIINTIPGVTHLIMGSESGDSNLLETLGDIQAKESPSYKTELKKSLSGGKSYARALTDATAAEAVSRGLDKTEVAVVLNRPNNILAVAYKKMLVLTKSKIRFAAAPRIPEYLSASEIRNNFLSDAAEKAMPAASYTLTKDELSKHYVRTGELEAIMLHAIHTSTQKQIVSTPDCAEGLEYKIKKAAHTAATFGEFLNICTSSRHTTGRIKRICLYNLFRADKKMQNSGYAFARLLGIKNDAAGLLKILPKNIITNKAAEKNIPEKYLKIYEIDKIACRIYSTVTHKSGDNFYKGLIKI